MSPAQFLSIVLARWRLVGVCVVLLVATAVVATLLSPKRWTAASEVLIDLRAADLVSGVAPNPSAQTGFIATQADVIGSLRVARIVTERLGLDRSGPYFEAWSKRHDGSTSTADARAGVAEALLKKLEVRPSKESNVIRVAFTAKDPVLAAQVANAFAQTYIDTTVDLLSGSARKNAELLDSRVASARSDVEKAQARLSAYQRESGVTGVDEKLDVENARLNELSSQLVALQAVLSENRSRAGASRDVENMSEVLDSKLIQQLKADMAKIEGKLRESETRLGTAHPEYQSLSAELASLRQRVEAETRRYAGSFGVAGTVNAQRESQLRVALEAQRARVVKLREHRDRISVLQREVETAQRGYEQLAIRLNGLQAESMNRQSNANLLTEAVAPSEPNGPGLVLNLAMGLLFGLLIGLAVAVAFESRDRRARTLEDVMDAVPVPVLVVVPTALGTGATAVLPRAAHVIGRGPRRALGAPR